MTPTDKPPITAADVTDIEWHWLVFIVSLAEQEGVITKQDAGRLLCDKLACRAWAMNEGAKR